MAYLPSFQDFSSYLKGSTDESALFPTSPILKSGTGATGTQSFGATAPTPAPTPTTAPAPTAPAAPTSPGPSSVAPGSGIGRYFAPIASGVQKQQKSADEVYNAFSEQAGPARQEFGDPERQTLTQAYKAPSEEGTQQAKALVGAKYTGPKGLDQGQVAGITQGADELRDQARALRTTGGLQTTIQDTTPGLTGGSAKFEARHILKDPGTKQKSREAEETVNRFYGGLTTGQEKAKEFAAARTAQEADVAKQSRALLEGAESGLLGQVDARVAQEEATRQAAADAWYRYNADPSDENLLALQAHSQADLSKAADTSGEQLTREAEAKYTDIFAQEKYAAIKDMPPLVRNITDRGREYYAVVQPDGTKVDIRNVKGLPKKEHKLLIERQRELESQFRATAGDKGGKYQDVMPLYGEGSHDDAGKYVPFDPLKNAYKPSNLLTEFSTTFDPGMSPSRQNLSTEAERSQFNAIQEIMDNVERLEQSGDPFRAAQLAVDLDKYLADEEAVMEERKAAGDKTAEDWGRQVKKARKSARKNRDKKAWGAVSNIIMGEWIVGETKGTGGVGANLGHTVVTSEQSTR